MSRNFIEEYDGPALEKCFALRLHPIPHPLGDDHHTDAQFTDEDNAIGDALAYFLGTLFSDVDGEGSEYWYKVRTSVDEWRRVARALRIHGLQISDRKFAKQKQGTVRVVGINDQGREVEFTGRIPSRFL